MTTLLLIVSLFSQALAVECDGLSVPDELRADLEKAQASYGEMDVDGFVLDIGSAETKLHCIDRRLPTDLAANYHRMTAIRLFLNGETDDSNASLAAAATLEPRFSLSKLFPEGHEFPARFEEYKTLPSPTTRIPKPRDGYFAFDGDIGRDRPLARATIVQRLDADGQIRSTQVLLPDDPLPHYPRVLIVRNALLVSAAGTATLGVTTAAFGMNAKSRFGSTDEALQRDLQRSDLDRLRSTANAMSTATGTLSGVTLALLGTALVVKR